MKNKENQEFFIKVMVQYFTIILKKKTNNKVPYSEIKLFLKKWDSTHILEGFFK